MLADGDGLTKCQHYRCPFPIVDLPLDTAFRCIINPTIRCARLQDCKTASAARLLCQSFKSWIPLAVRLNVGSVMPECFLYKARKP